MEQDIMKVVNFDGDILSKSRTIEIYTWPRRDRKTNEIRLHSNGEVLLDVEIMAECDCDCCDTDTPEDDRCADNLYLPERCIYDGTPMPLPHKHNESSVDELKWRLIGGGYNVEWTKNK